MNAPPRAAKTKTATAALPRGGRPYCAAAKSSDVKAVAAIRPWAIAIQVGGISVPLNRKTANVAPPRAASAKRIADTFMAHLPFVPIEHSSHFEQNAGQNTLGGALRVAAISA